MTCTIKDVPSVTLLSAATKIAGFHEVAPFAQKTIPQHYAKCKELNLTIVGPEIFTYHFREHEAIDLRTGIVVKEARGNPAPLEFFTTQPVKCITCIHKGSMKTIGQSWDALTHEAGDRKLAFTNEIREVYLVWKDFDSAENETELQRVLK